MAGPSSIDPASARRGQVYWVNLDPTIGSEQGKKRPCLVVSPDALNSKGNWNTVVVLPITSKGEANTLCVPVSAGKTSGLALIAQVRTIDKRRLASLAGPVSRDELETVLVTLRKFFG